MHVSVWKKPTMKANTLFCALALAVGSVNAHAKELVIPQMATASNKSEVVVPQKEVDPSEYGLVSSTKAPESESVAPKQASSAGVQSATEKRKSFKLMVGVGIKTFQLFLLTLPGLV